MPQATDKSHEVVNSASFIIMSTLSFDAQYAQIPMHTERKDKAIVNVATKQQVNNNNNNRTHRKLRFNW